MGLSAWSIFVLRRDSVWTPGPSGSLRLGAGGASTSQQCCPMGRSHAPPRGHWRSNDLGSHAVTGLERHLRRRLGAACGKPGPPASSRQDTEGSQGPDVSHSEEGRQPQGTRSPAKSQQASGNPLPGAASLTMWPLCLSDGTVYYCHFIVPPRTLSLFVGVWWLLASFPRYVT